MPDGASPEPISPDSISPDTIIRVTAPDFAYMASPNTHRVRRTFGFVDLSGFTSFNNSAGDTRAVAELSEFRAIVRSVGSATGIRVAKWLGDGAMLVGLEPAALVSAVTQIMRRMHERSDGLALHAGVAEGNVILFEGDDHIGTAVNMAARLADSAEPWQILAPADLIPGASRTKAAIDPIFLPGFDDPVAVVDLALVPALVEALNL